MAAILTCSLFVPTQFAHASFLSFKLSQSGWRGGGQVVGKFSGSDSNADGLLKLTDGELAAYQITFSGNSLLPDFCQDLDDLYEEQGRQG